MKRTYPTLFKFLIAEQVRQETGGKHTIIGLYPGDKLNLATFTPPTTDEKGGEIVATALDSLYVFSVFKDGIGEFNSNITIITPSGKILAKSAGKDLMLKRGVDLVMTLGIVPFPTPELGVYQCIFTIGTKQYPCNFSVECETAEVIKPKEKPKPRRKKSELCI